jgi:hypothetical protein
VAIRQVLCGNKTPGLSTRDVGNNKKRAIPDHTSSHEIMVLNQVTTTATTATTTTTTTTTTTINHHHHYYFVGATVNDKSWPVFFFLFLNHTQSVGLFVWRIRPPQGRYVHTGHHKTQNKRSQASTPRVGIAPTTPMFGRAKTVHALDRAATVTTWTQILSRSASHQTSGSV